MTTTVLFHNTDNFIKHLVAIPTAPRQTFAQILSCLHHNWHLRGTMIMGDTGRTLNPQKEWKKTFLMLKLPLCGGSRKHW